MSEDKIDRKLEEAVEADTQLLAIGGSIGTALFISIGNGLAAGGPGSLLVAYTLYALVIACINNCVAEMTVLQPVSGGFIRLAGKWVDDALGFMVGWNFFFYEALMIPYEITAINLVLGYWRDDIPVAAVCAACIALYTVINFLAVRAYGEAEFWLSSGKILLIFTLIFFTFITMVGGNPQHDAYGFRYWRHPSAFAEYRHPGQTGRFEGFLAALWSAAFTIVGPEYISMSAAEAQRPRTVVKAAFKTIYWRFGLFFVLGATCVGIVVPWTDPTLQAILHGQSRASGAAASPYVIAMANLQITGLPHLVNALLITSIFSAGNTLTYCATRSLYGLALEGRAPRLLTKTRNGVPVYAFGVVICFPFLSFLQLSNNSARVLNLLVSLMTAGALIDFLVMCITYLQFYRACQVQGLDRATLPYVGWGQPYCAWVGLVAMAFVLLGYGYTAFAPWDVQAFFENYTMQLVAPVLFFGWKWAKGTTLLQPEEVDLVWEAPAVDAYEASFEGPMAGFWEEVVGLHEHQAAEQ
ncbi:amino acid transporter [Aspergillus fijiensis CBS 313.89]|uniref:Amino acid transporter n=1 Tax=Aspergillus fijiensis CBS 313.89 TaxID=1448319 RepID=A0A8G1RSM0_9EURO|nr:amino acid transporter [Aspergillus fijiensis CBS 313.89]RAK78134.1 amino acid transporter [Aspergillus fijiensis CBS 313.89]